VRFFQHYLTVAVLLLALAEAAAFLVSPSIAAMLVPGPGGWRLSVVDTAHAVEYAVIMLVPMVALGLYHRRQRATLTGVLLRAAVALAAGGAFAGLVSFFVLPLAIGRGILLGSILVSFVFVAIARTVFERVADDSMFKRRILVVGAGRVALTISQLRRRTDTRGFAVAGFMPVEGDQPALAEDRLIRRSGALYQYCKEADIDEIVVALDDRRRSFPVFELLDCRIHGVEVVDIVDFLERETGKVRLDVLNPSWIIFAPGFSHSLWRRLTKRVFDVMASVLLLALSWPIMLLAVLAIKLEDGWRAPVLYRQERVGIDGRKFFVLKFRSMHVDAERDGARWAAQRDSRVTRFGAFARKTRVDELPQILNVLKQDMSFVGPRPERPQFVMEFEERIPYFKERHCVRPGITGWAQLCYPYGASEQDATEKLQYDLYYVKNHGFIFDFLILLQTVEVVLWGRGGR
jgi:sugar transferase (PEP-CTERM system associated)